MQSTLVLYATREGQTERIAEYVAERFRARGRRADVVNVAQLPADFHLNTYAVAILAASVHESRHEKEMVAFVKQHAAELERLHAVFLSVSLSAAHEQGAADVERMMEAFFAETGWHPEKAQPVAGALLFSKYNFVIRAVMKRIAGKAGAPTDTSRDYEFTDWAALDRMVEEIAGPAALCAGKV